ncbi:MAG: hypothetical protein ACLPIX_09620 [Rhodomicrobium sp.]
MKRAALYAILALLPAAPGFAQNMPAKPMSEKVEDNRRIVPLSEAESALVAAKMRQMLASIQGVTDGLARGDMQAVGLAASQSGMSMMQDLPAEVRAKFPPPFMQMGMASHKAFERIAQEAAGDKNSETILKQLSSGTQFCVACHAAYRFAPPK